MRRGNRNNRVIIRIWASKRNRGENVGHISIQTPNRYMSLWPNNKDQGLGVLLPIQPEFKVNADADIEEEGRVPEKLYCLYSLDVTAMEAQFDVIKSNQSFKGWVLIGDNLLLNKGNAHSCSSLAYKVLLAGDIYSLLSHGYSSNFSSITSPDLLDAALSKAKQTEFASYPNSKKYTRFRRTTIINTTQYTEQETQPLQKKACEYCTTSAMAATAVGLFAVGYCVLYPENASEYMQSFKSHFNF